MAIQGPGSLGLAHSDTFSSRLLEGVRVKASALLHLPERCFGGMFRSCMLLCPDEILS